jgi:cytochrome c556
MAAGGRRLAACAVAACILAGCGGGDDGQAERDRAYIEQVNTAVERFAREAKRLPSGFEAETLRTYSAALDRTAKRLRDIDPPPSVARLHAQLADDVAVYADAIEAAAQAPLSEDADRVVAAQQDVMRATETANTEVNRTLEAIGRRLDESG